MLFNINKVVPKTLICLFACLFEKIQDKNGFLEIKNFTDAKNYFVREDGLAQFI
jgi:hypothetical protein